VGGGEGGKTRFWKTSSHSDVSPGCIWTYELNPKECLIHTALHRLHPLSEWRKYVGTQNIPTYRVQKPGLNNVLEICIINERKVSHVSMYSNYQNESNFQQLLNCTVTYYRNAYHRATCNRDWYSILVYQPLQYKRSCEVLTFFRPWPQNSELDPFKMWFLLQTFSRILRLWKHLLQVASYKVVVLG
jgi:hypothetical protein